MVKTVKQRVRAKAGGLWIRVQVVVGWILVTHDGYGGLRSCEHRYGVGVKNGLKKGDLRQSAYRKVQPKAPYSPDRRRETRARPRGPARAGVVC